MEGRDVTIHQALALLKEAYQDACYLSREKAGIVGAQPAIMGTSDNQRVAEVLRGQLADIGVDVQFDLLQQAAWNERWTVGDFDWIINGSVVDADPDDGQRNTSPSVR